METSNKMANHEILEKSLLPLEKDLKAIFEEKLDEYDLSKSKVLALLNIDARTFDDLLDGKASQPNLINVIKIADFLDIDVKEVLPTILKNQPAEIFKSIQRAKKVSFIGKFFDIKNLIKVGFLDNADDIDDITRRILSFFGFASINDFQTQLVSPLYSKTKRKFSDKMKAFWIASAIQCFKQINNPNEYDREALKDIIVKIKPYSQDVEHGLLTVCKALYNVGVTVIVQGHLTLTQIRGGTFIIDGKPCIVLTDLNKRYTTIWETLLHELHHSLFDFDIIERNLYHLNGDPDLLLIEDKAEDFSLEYFCGYDKYKFIKPHIFNHVIVKKYAAEWEIHPAFIYSAFRYFQEKHHGKNYYGAFNDYFPETTVATKRLKPINWKEQSLTDIADQLKLIFELKINSDEK